MWADLLPPGPGRDSRSAARPRPQPRDGGTPALQLRPPREHRHLDRASSTGALDYTPQAHRHLAARQGDATGGKKQLRLSRPARRRRPTHHSSRTCTPRGLKPTKAAATTRPGARGPPMHRTTRRASRSDTADLDSGCGSPTSRHRRRSDRNAEGAERQRCAEGSPEFVTDLEDAPVVHRADADGLADLCTEGRHPDQARTAGSSAVRVPAVRRRPRGLTARACGE